MNDSLSQFGLRMKSARENAGYTPQDVYEKIEIGPTQTSRYERGMTYPRIESLLKLSALYNVSPDYLLLGISHVKVNGGEVDAQFEETLRIAQDRERELQSLLDKANTEAVSLNEKIGILQDRIKDKEQTISAMDRALQTLDKMNPS